MSSSFEWYEVVEDSDEITQGDIFINLPIIVSKNYNDMVAQTSFEKCTIDDKFELNVEVEFGDFIVLTQPCDILQGKPELKDIILCGINDIKDLNFSKKVIGECISGKRPQFYVLNENIDFKCQYKEDGFNFHVVNFDMIEKVPIETLKEIGRRTHKRLRLLPPYREHLSQAFAKYFMRIGLPSDIVREKIYEFAKTN